MERIILLLSLLVSTILADNAWKFKVKQAAVAFRDKKISKTYGFNLFEAQGHVLVYENSVEKAKPDKDLKNLKDYTIQGLFFEDSSYNSNSIYILIESIDLTKQQYTDSGYIMLKEVTVRYKDYVPGIILGRKIADRTVV